MTELKTRKVEWRPCPPGALATLADQERLSQRRQFLVRAGRAVGVLALASGVGWQAFRMTRKPIDPVFGEIACSRVRELAPQFLMGTLDKTVTRQIKTHLELCADCRGLLESMQPKVSARSPHDRSPELCQCLTCRRDGVVKRLTTAIRGT